MGLKREAMSYVWNQLTDIDKAEIDVAIDKAWHNHTGILIEGDEYTADELKTDARCAKALQATQ